MARRSPYVGKGNASCASSSSPCQWPLAEVGVQGGAAAERSEGTLDAAGGQWHSLKPSVRNPLKFGVSGYKQLSWLDSRVSRSCAPPSGA